MTRNILPNPHIWHKKLHHVVKAVYNTVTVPDSRSLVKVVLIWLKMNSIRQNI